MIGVVLVHHGADATWKKEKGKGLSNRFRQSCKMLKYTNMFFPAYHQVRTILVEITAEEITVEETMVENSTAENTEEWTMVVRKVIP